MNYFKGHEQKVLAGKLLRYCLVKLVEYLPSVLAILLLITTVFFYVLCFYPVVPAHFDHWGYWAGRDSVFSLPNFNLFHRVLRYPLVLFYQFWKSLTFPEEFLHPSYLSLSLPIFLSAAQVVATFMCCALCNKGERRYFWVGLFAGLFLAIHLSAGVRVFGVSDCLLSVFVIFSSFFALQEERIDAWLCALLFSLAYATKVTALFFLPGVLLFFLIERRYRAVLIFMLVFLSYLLLETLFFALNFEIVGGRLGALSQSYGYSGRLEEIAFSRLVEVFGRFTSLPYRGTEVLLLGVLTAFSTLIRYFKGRDVVRLELLSAVCLLSYLFFITFSFKSLSPLTPLMLFHWRYLIPIYPFLGINIYFVLFSCPRKKTLEERLPKRAPSFCSQHNFRFILSLVFAVGFLFFSFTPASYTQTKRMFAVLVDFVQGAENNGHPWKRFAKEAQFVVDSVQSNRVLVGQDMVATARLDHLLSCMNKRSEVKVMRCGHGSRFAFVPRQIYKSSALSDREQFCYPSEGIAVGSYKAEKDIRRSIEYQDLREKAVFEF